MNICNFYVWVTFVSKSILLSLGGFKVVMVEFQRILSDDFWSANVVMTFCNFYDWVTSVSEAILFTSGGFNFNEGA